MDTSEGGFGPGGLELRIEGFTDFVPLGQGGFGAVYQARQPRLNRDVAIKILMVAGMDDRTRRRFEREQQAMGALSAHPAIVTLYDSGFTETGFPYLAMELMPRGSLADRLDREGPMPWSEAVSVIARIADAVGEAHRAGVLHRDIKPENILISAYGEAKLTDFGVSVLMGRTATATASVTATVEHAAPEVLAGKTPDERADVYSLGSTLFALLAGHSPFRRATDDSVLPVLARVATEPVPDLRDRGIPDAVCAVLEAATAKDPDERIAAADEFAARLRTLATASPTVAAGAAPREVSPSAVPEPLPGGATAPVPRPEPAALSCRSCGAALRPGVKFCESCGMPITEDAADARRTRIVPRRTDRPVSAPDTGPVAVSLAGVPERSIGRVVGAAAQRSGDALVVEAGPRLGRKGRESLHRALFAALDHRDVDRIEVRRLGEREQRKLEALAVSSGLVVHTRGGTTTLRRPGAPIDGTAATTAGVAPADEPESAPSAADGGHVCSVCGFINPADADECDQCGHRFEAPGPRRFRAAVAVYAGALALVAGPFLPWFRGNRFVNAFTPAVTEPPFWQDRAAGWWESIGLLLVICAVAAAVAIEMKVSRWWARSAATVSLVVAGLFVVGNVVEYYDYSPSVVFLIRGSAAGPWIVIAGALFVIGHGLWRHAPAVTAAAIISGGGLLAGFGEWSLSSLWGRTIAFPSWWNTTGFVLVVIGLAAAVAALRSMPRTLLAAGAGAVLLVVAKAVALATTYSPASFGENLIVRSGPLALALLGGAVLILLTWPERDVRP